MVDTYRRDQLAKYNRWEADGKNFDFCGKYFPISVDDPVASGWEITGGTLRDYKAQFINT